MVEFNRPGKTLEFGRFRIDGTQRLLSSAGQLVPLEPKVFDTLLALVEAGGRLLSKEELLQRVWPGTFVEEGGLARNVSAIRKVLGEGADSLKYIETIPKRGYRFVAPVRIVLGETTTAAAEIPPATPDEQPARVPMIEPASDRDHAIADTASVRRRAFRWVAATALVLAVGAIVVWQREAARSPDAVAPTIRSLAVLPLQNLSGDPDQEYFADGITEELIATLAQIDTLRVISRTSAMQYKGTTKSLTETARELNVGAILEGSIQRSDGKVRITVQLVEAATDMHLWARTFDGNISDLLRVQAEVARAVAEEIRVQLTSATLGRLAARPAVNPAAYDEVLRGHAYRWRGGEPAYLQAVKHYRRAIELQPDYALAHAGLALALTLMSTMEHRAPARTAAIRALELDPNLAEAHAAKAAVESRDWNWDAQDYESRRALEISPGILDGCYCYIIDLAATGRPTEAVTVAEQALARNPLAVGAHQAMGFALYYARRYSDAIVSLERAIAIDERNLPSYSNLTRAYIAAGRPRDAITLLEHSPLKHSIQMATAYASVGRADDAKRMADELATSSPPVDHIGMARYYLALGDREGGLEQLTEAINAREARAHFVIGAEFDSVRTDPRFVTLVAKLRFPPSYEAFLASVRPLSARLTLPSVTGRLSRVECGTWRRPRTLPHSCCYLRGTTNESPSARRCQARDRT